VQKLRVELLQVDWAAQLKSSLLEAEYTQVSGVTGAALRGHTASLPGHAGLICLFGGAHQTPAVPVTPPASRAQAITAAISSAGSSTAQAAAQLQQLATELLQSRHIQQLSSALSSVVYGQGHGQQDQAGSSSSSTEALAALASDIYQQQQQEEEEQQRVRWQRQVDAWQQQRQQQHGSGPPSQQQQQLQAWQADVIRTWVDDVSGWQLRAFAC
jgi:hypothetical protein